MRAGCATGNAMRPVGCVGALWKHFETLPQLALLSRWLKYYLEAFRDCRHEMIVGNIPSFFLLMPGIILAAFTALGLGVQADRHGTRHATLLSLPMEEGGGLVLTECSLINIELVVVLYPGAYLSPVRWTFFIQLCIVTRHTVLATQMYRILLHRSGTYHSEAFSRVPCWLVAGIDERTETREEFVRDLKATGVSSLTLG